MQPKTKYTSRRSVLKRTVFGLGLISSPMALKYAMAQSKRILIRDDGGIYTRAYGSVFYRPFTEQTGIEVKGIQAVAEPVAQIKQIVNSQEYKWHMAKLSQPAILLLTSSDKKYLVKHGLDDEPVIKSIPAKFKSAYGVGTNVYSTVLAYKESAFAGRNPPKSWADFWNIKDYPGSRSMRRHPFDTLEEALLASGTSGDKLYPLNINLAFRSLDKIAPYIDVWWGTGAQIERMLKAGEVDLIATWVSRAQSAISDKNKIKIVWNQNLWGVDNWAILADNPYVDECREFIKFASDPKRQAMLFEYFPAGVTQPAAFDYVNPVKAQHSPTYAKNMKNGIQIDASYWLKNQANAIGRFTKWISS